MKASHFNIGNPKGNMIHPKPIPPQEIETQATVFSIEDAKKRLG